MMMIDAKTNDNVSILILTKIYRIFLNHQKVFPRPSGNQPMVKNKDKNATLCYYCYTLFILTHQKLTTIQDFTSSRTLKEH